jgi:hypothetical protein
MPNLREVAGWMVLGDGNDLPGLSQLRKIQISWIFMSSHRIRAYHTTTVRGAPTQPGPGLASNTC